MHEATQQLEQMVSKVGVATLVRSKLRCWEVGGPDAGSACSADAETVKVCQGLSKENVVEASVCFVRASASR